MRLCQVHSASINPGFRVDPIGPCWPYFGSFSSEPLEIGLKWFASWISDVGRPLTVHRGSVGASGLHRLGVLSVREWWSVCYAALLMLSGSFVWFPVYGFASRSLLTSPSLRCVSYVNEGYIFFRVLFFLVSPLLYWFFKECEVAGEFACVGLCYIGD